MADAESLSLNAFKTVLDIDTVGTFLMSKVCYTKYFKKHGGNIVNISMTLHHLGTLMQAHSCSAKAAIDALTKVFALEWGPKGVRVNGIAPGPIEGTEGLDRLSDFAKSNNKSNLGKKTELSENDIASLGSKLVPLQRYGNPKDVSNTAIYLFSDASSLMTGQTLVIDGGCLPIAPNWMVFFPEFRKAWTAKF